MALGKLFTGLGKAAIGIADTLSENEKNKYLRNRQSVLDKQAEQEAMQKQALNQIELEKYKQTSERNKAGFDLLDKYNRFIPTSDTARDLTQDELTTALQTGIDPDIKSSQFQPSGLERARGLGLTTMQDVAPVKELVTDLTTQEAEKTKAEDKKKALEEERAYQEKQDLISFEREAKLKEKLDAKKEDKENFTQEQQLRTQLDGLSKDFVSVRDSYNRIKTVTKEPSPAGDLSMIYNYMKMLDPGSTVRESEFATAAQAGSFGDRIQSAVGKIVTGKRLDDSQRKDFVAQAEKLYTQQKVSHKALINKYNKIAGAYGLNPERVTSGFQIDELYQPKASGISDKDKADAIWGE